MALQAKKRMKTNNDASKESPEEVSTLWNYLSSYFS